jgi:hypothetical protein
VMGVLTVVRACFDVLEVVGVYALFLGSGTFGNRDLGWTVGPPKYNTVYYPCDL